MVDVEGAQEAGASRGVSRRTIMKGAAWTVPALMVATAAPAYAASCMKGQYTTQGHGKLLGGSILGLNLDTIVALAGAHATAPTPADPDNQFGALNLSALNVQLPTAPVGVLLSNVLSLLVPAGTGTLNQYGYAESDGDSRGASGLVTNTGALALNKGESMPQLGTLDLKTILANLTGSGVADLVSYVANLSLEIGAVAGRAWYNPCKDVAGAVNRDYLLGYLRIILQSTALSGLVNTLVGAVNAVLGVANAAIALAGYRLFLDTSLITGSIPAGNDQPIQVNLGDGKLTIDVGTLLGGGADPFNASYSTFLNGLAPNTILFADATTQLPANTVTNFMTGLTNSLEALLLNGLQVQQYQGPVIGGTWVTIGSLGTLLSTIPALQAAWDIIKAVLTGVALQPVFSALQTALNNLFNVLQNVLRITINAQNPTYRYWNGILNPSSAPTHTKFSVAALYIQAIGALNVLDLYLAAGGVGSNTTTAP
ncbi:MAG: choice-of-anchor G family protein [Actinobacteria bacterium]|nr:choice-of-anchor G family protein [Actinomycetota bacterium]